MCSKSSPLLVVERTALCYMTVKILTVICPQMSLPPWHWIPLSTSLFIFAQETLENLDQTCKAVSSVNV